MTLHSSKKYPSLQFRIKSYRPPPPPPSGAPSPPIDQGDSVIDGAPGAAAKIGSTPDNRVTAVTVALPGSGCDATIITASPTFKSAIVLFGSRLTNCERSPPADRPAPPARASPDALACPAPAAPLPAPAVPPPAPVA